MRIKFFLIMILCFYSHFAHSRNIDVLIYADDAYNPYSYVNVNNEASGIYAEILYEAFSNMKGYNVSIQAVPWKRAMFALEKSEVFAAFPPYYRPLERPYIGVYSEPILEEEIVVYTRKDVIQKPRPIWPQDWKGLTVGIFLGTDDIAGKDFVDMINKKQIFKFESKGHDKIIELLLSGKVDAYVNDRISIETAIQNFKKHKHFAREIENLVVAQVVSRENGYLAFTNNKKKFPYRDDFISKFNDEIIKMKANNRISEIVKKHLQL